MALSIKKRYFRPETCFVSVWIVFSGGFLHNTNKPAAQQGGGSQKIAGSGGSETASVWFQTKLTGARRLPRGFSGFRPEARKARRPCGLSCGIGVGDPSPQAPPRQAGRVLLFHNLKFYSIFFKKLRFPKAEPLVAHRNERNILSCEARFSGELPHSGKRGLFASEKAPLHK